MSNRVLRFPDTTWDELEGLPQPLRNAAHAAIIHLLQEPVPAGWPEGPQIRDTADCDIPVAAAIDRVGQCVSCPARVPPGSS